MAFHLFFVNCQALLSFTLEPGDQLGLDQHLFFQLGKSFFRCHELLS